MRPLHAQLSPRLWRRLSFSNHEANDQTGIDFRGENASIQTYRDVETGQRPCDVRNAHARRDFLIGNDERTGGKPPFGLRPTVGITFHVSVYHQGLPASSIISYPPWAIDHNRFRQEGLLMTEIHGCHWTGKELANRCTSDSESFAKHPQRLLTDSMRCRPGDINRHASR